jgi:hypothetical protein
LNSALLTTGCAADERCWLLAVDLLFADDLRLWVEAILLEVVLREEVFPEVVLPEVLIGSVLLWRVWFLAGAVVLVDWLDLVALDLAVLVLVFASSAVFVAALAPGAANKLRAQPQINKALKQRLRSEIVISELLVR